MNIVERIIDILSLIVWYQVTVRLIRWDLKDNTVPFVLKAVGWFGWLLFSIILFFTTIIDIL